MKDFTIICPSCGDKFVISVRVDDIIKYNEGALIQNAFPYLSAAERELYKSGICGTCWDKMFPVEDD